MPFGNEAASGYWWEPDGDDRYCWRCGTTCPIEVITDSGCSACRSRVVPWDCVVRLGAYEIPLSEWIVACKFHGHWAWASWLGTQLARSVSTTISPGLIVPVPLHWQRRIGRGYNQASLIGRAMAKELGWPFAPVVRRRRSTRPQSDVGSIGERQNDLRGVFDVRVDLEDQSIILVDDVCTSGATAAACVRELRKSGAKRVILAVAAVAGPRTTLGKIKKV